MPVLVLVLVLVLPSDRVPSHELRPKGRSSSMAGVEDMVTFEAPPALDHMKHKSNKPCANLCDGAKQHCRNVKHGVYIILLLLLSFVIVE